MEKQNKEPETRWIWLFIAIACLYLAIDTTAGVVVNITPANLGIMSAVILILLFLGIFSLIKAFKKDDKETSIQDKRNPDD